MYSQDILAQSGDWLMFHMILFAYQCFDSDSWLSRRNILTKLIFWGTFFLLALVFSRIVFQWMTISWIIRQAFCDRINFESRLMIAILLQVFPSLFKMTFWNIYFHVRSKMGSDQD